MNIKQSLRTIDKTLTNENNRPFGSEAYCPTSDEIENDNVKRLAKRLKAASLEETLTNILEWQEKNIVFWSERHPLVDIFWVSVLTLLFGTLALSILRALNILPLSFFSWFVVKWLVIWASSIVTTLTIMIFILHSNRKFPWKEVPKGVINAFMPSISIDFLLEKKLGVCKDYAKLTACLLSNINSNAEIYFAHARDHTATGIAIENRLYMLDQRLPILTKDRWNDYRKPRKYHTIERFDPIKNTLRKVDKGRFPQTKDKPELNTEELSKISERMTELLNIGEQSHDRAIPHQKTIPIPWKNGVILYEENEMTDYSLARFLTMKISGELIRVNQITRVETSLDENDLIFQIHVRMDTQ